MTEFYVFFIFMAFFQFFYLKKQCDKKEMAIYCFFMLFTFLFAIWYFRNSMKIMSFSEFSLNLISFGD